MRVLRANLKGIVESRSDASVLIDQPGDVVVVERARPRLLVLKCPDGCGEVLAINLDRQAGKAWRLYRNGNVITLFPSVWRDSGCESHFIISRGRIFLFGLTRDREPDDELWREAFDLKLDEVLDALSTSQLESVETVTERIPHALPWSVLGACRSLVREGRAIEGEGALKGFFRRS